MAALKSALAFALWAALTAPVHGANPLPPPIYAMATSRQFVGALYIDLSGILRSPKADKLPIWWDYLTPRSKALKDRLDQFDRQADWTTFRYDWLCQCHNIHKLWAQPFVLVNSETSSRARLTVTVRISGGERHSVQLLLINREGWMIDDIIDERGYRYTESLARAITTYEQGRKPLPEDRPQ